MSPPQRRGSKGTAATQLTPQGIEQEVIKTNFYNDSSEQSSVNNILKLSDDYVESLLQAYHAVETPDSVNYFTLAQSTHTKLFVSVSIQYSFSLTIIYHIKVLH